MNARLAGSIGEESASRGEDSQQIRNTSPSLSDAGELREHRRRGTGLAGPHLSHRVATEDAHAVSRSICGAQRQRKMGARTCEEEDSAERLVADEL